MLELNNQYEGLILNPAKFILLNSYNENVNIKL